ncbi:hypothetical protein [uncultured Ornithinimicrobium sp.]|uniref:hypothetical protein n=1 Tax=uncultured Ornithinimicrobium sp. TaxID=259307 RepID=UPI0025984BE4|nr:hypothetical protein [uncultured Ornithinimicrobium sp.]
MTTQAQAQASPLAPADADAGRRPPEGAGHRSDGAADRWMRRVLGVEGVDRRSGQGAHRAFRVSVVVSAVRCVVTYVAVPVLLPVLSLAGWVAAPIGLALCAVAAVTGVLSLRRFWRADHAYRWTYTAFITVVLVILAVATMTELDRIGAVL